MTVTAGTDWTSWYAERAGRMLDELGSLVRIESPSRDAKGIREIVRWFERELARTGAHVEVIDEHVHGPNLVARFGEGADPILLVGHTDTVWPRGTLERMPWRVDGDAAFGPGVFDMKAGCLVVLEAIRGLAEHGHRTPLTVVFNCDEEIGSASSRSIIEREAREARAVLVFEPALPGGRAKTSRSGVANYHVAVTGRAAHAGVDPDKGISAIGAAAGVVTRVHALNDLANGLSINVGVIRGGTRSNVIAAHAELEIDVRFRRAEQAGVVDLAIRDIAGDHNGARIDVTGGIDRPPFERTPHVVELFERAARAANQSGFELGEGHVGGASDGNFTAALGIPTLDGLGVDGMGAHADHEQIVVADLPRRPAMLVRLLLDLASA